MCIKTEDIGKLLRHQTHNKKNTRETLTQRTYISAKATALAEIRPRRPIRVIADIYPNL